MNRRDILGLALLGAACPAGSLRAMDAPVIEVWKTASCGCCRAWVRHVEDAGFSVKLTELDDMTPVKQRFNIPPELSSCHTALAGGYVVEGHVPADDVIRMLRQKPRIKGIYVPGMPAGSPGMEAPHGEKYDVLALDDTGKVSIFATHQP